MKQLYKRVLSCLLCSALLIGLLSTSGVLAANESLDNFAGRNVYKENMFSDVAADAWYAKNVQSAYTMGLMYGKSNSRFDPEGNITLAETIAIAARLHSIFHSKRDDFIQDTPWYQVYVEYAMDTGLIEEAYSDYSRTVTRAEFAQIIGQALPDKALRVIGNVPDGAIPDVRLDDVNGQMIYKLYRAGVLTGNDEKGTFTPNRPIRRCEIAAIVSRMADADLRIALDLHTEAIRTPVHNSSPEPEPEPDYKVFSIITDDCSTLNNVYAFSDAAAFVVDGTNVGNVGDDFRFQMASLQADYIIYQANTDIKAAAITAYYHGDTTDTEGLKHYDLFSSEDGINWKEISTSDVAPELVQGIADTIDWYGYRFTVEELPPNTRFLRIQWPVGYTVGYATELGNVSLTVAGENGAFVQAEPANPAALLADIQRYTDLLAVIIEGADIGDTIPGAKNEFQHYLDAALELYKSGTTDSRTILIEQSRLKKAYERLLGLKHQPGDVNLALLPAIEQAQALLSGAVEGSKIGQYESGAKAALEASIAAAQTISAENNLTESDLCAAVNTLRRAMSEFGAKKNQPELPAAYQSENNFTEFVTRDGDQLMIGDAELQFASVNMASTWGIQHPSWKNTDIMRAPTAYEQEDLLKTVRLLGGQVARTYVFPIQRGATTKYENSVYLLNDDGTLNDEEFAVIDQMLALANQYGVRLIIPLIDQWEHHGGIRQFVEIFGEDGSPDSAFYQDATIVAAFKNYISQILNHTNSITGVAYKDDMAILAWETGNELNAPEEWTAEIAAHIKSVDTNHLVMDGTYGISDRALFDGNVDIVSNHYYNPSSVTEYAERYMRDALKADGKKAFVVGEYGNSSNIQNEINLMDAVAEKGTSGSLIWCLYGHSNDGGFSADTDLHYPGKNESQAVLMEHLRQLAFSLQGVEVPPTLALDAPVLLPIETQFEIVWRGSAGAESYRLERSIDQSEWTTVAAGFKEGSGMAHIPASDPTVVIGQTYYYRVVAVNGSIESTPSNTVAFMPTLTADVRDLQALIAQAETLLAVENEEEYLDGAAFILERATKIARNTYASAYAAPTQDEVDASEKNLLMAIETFHESKRGAPATVLYDNMSTFGTASPMCTQMYGMEIDSGYTGLPGKSAVEHPTIRRSIDCSDGWLIYYSEEPITRAAVNCFIHGSTNDTSKLEIWGSKTGEDGTYVNLNANPDEGVYYESYYWYGYTYTANMDESEGYHFIKVLLKAYKTTFDITWNWTRFVCWLLRTRVVRSIPTILVLAIRTTRLGL